MNKKQAWNRGEKIAFASFLFTVISCVAAVIVVPEVRLGLGFNGLVTTENAEASFLISGHNNNIRIISGRSPNMQNDYAFEGDNTTTAITLASGTLITLKMKGANNSVFVSKNLVIKATTDNGLNNNVIRLE